MNRLFQVLCCIFIFAAAHSQDLATKLTGALTEVSRNIPPDRLFLHLDRNLYHPHDTIRFQAYIRDSRTGVFTTESSSLYVMLISSGLSTIDSARFRISNPVVPGWLAIPDSIAAGDYSVLAFTSIDMNFDPAWSYTAPVSIRPRVQPGSRESIKKVKGDSLQQKDNFDQQTLDLKFLPEGGTFVSGIRQKLAFNAVTSDGKTMCVSGKILNRNGVHIADFRSEPAGPGMVEFRPATGEVYHALVDGPQFMGMQWQLPVPEDKGVAMQAINNGNGVINILLRGRHTEGKSYFLTVTMNNVLIMSETFRMDTVFRKKILTDRLPAGTAYISLYDMDLRPVAERLVFLNNYKRMHVNLAASQKYFFGGEEAELTISTTDEDGEPVNSYVSVSVADSASGYDAGIPQEDIGSAFLYDKVFFDNLPRRIRAAGLENMDAGTMDLMLMTYGWRKFVPQEIVPGQEKEITNYDYLTIQNPGPDKKGRLDFNLISDAGTDVINLPVRNREAILYYDSLDIYARQIMILPDKAAVRNTNPVRVEFPGNSYYTVRAKQQARFPWYELQNIHFNPAPQEELRIDGYIPIETVNIRPPVQSIKPKMYVDMHARMYQSTGATTWYRKDFGSAFTLEDLLHRYNPFRFDDNWQLQGAKGGKRIYLRNTSNYLNGGHNEKINDKIVMVTDERTNAALFVVDNTAIGTDYEPICNMPVSMIASITFLRGIQGVTLYGSKANGGVVFITTVTQTGYTADQLDNVDEVQRSDDLMREVRLFRTETEYYIPAKEEVRSDPTFQNRPTILWRDNVRIDSTGTIRIKYPNNLGSGTAMILVNGITDTNLLGSSRFKYIVK